MQSVCKILKIKLYTDDVWYVGTGGVCGRFCTYPTTVVTGVGVLTVVCQVCCVVWIGSAINLYKIKIENTKKFTKFFVFFFLLRYRFS